MSAPALLPPEAELVVSSVTVTPGLIGIAARCVRPAAHCPRCGAVSDRVHSRYVRTVADLPWQGRRVVLRLTVRRFRCRAPGCDRDVFCERLSGVAAPHARATGRLTDIHRLIGFALGGEPGARLCGPLAVPTSPDTLLRRVKATPLPQRPAPRVLGVDDFAFRKGRTYGTILIDLERRRPLDLLPDRTGETLAAWLRANPGIEVISRDRFGPYAQAARGAAPLARQVADRFHLLVNLRDALERVFARHEAVVRAAFLAAQAAAPTPAAEPAASPTPRQQARDGRRARRCERFELTRRLRQDGWSIRRIARHLGMKNATVSRYLRSESCPDWRPGRNAPSRLDPYRGHLDRRWAEGWRSAKDLHREVAGLGYGGSYDQVRRYVQRLRGADGRLPDRSPAGPPPRRVEVPTARRLGFAVIRRPGDRSDEERSHLELARGGEGLRVPVALAEEFATLVRGGSAAGLGDWLGRAEASGAPELRGFAQGLRQDEAAVRAGLTEVWSNGPVEGQVNRVKVIKRQMYGRASFALLKARVLSTG
jgi:transposase